jgi:hypothetical protein
MKLEDIYNIKISSSFFLFLIMIVVAIVVFIRKRRQATLNLLLSKRYKISSNKKCKNYIRTIGFL